MNTHKTDVVVDIGCGDGYLRNFLNKNITYIGIDNNPFMINLCKKNTKIFFIVGNLIQKNYLT